MKPQKHQPYIDDVRRACLPEVMHVEDVALALGINEGEAEYFILAGRFGKPYLSLPESGPKILKRQFLAAIEAAGEQS